VSNREEMSRVPHSKQELFDLLCHRHAILLQGRPSMQPGMFKQQNNRAGDTVFVDARLVQGTLAKGFQRYEALQDPVARAIFMMFMISEVHPFNDGNGRMSRLITLLLLYQSGYFVGKYISIERLIADSKETYYEVLQESSAGWHEGTNDYLPFVRYILGIVVAAYREFTSRVDILITRGLSKPERVREIIRSTTGRITKTQIMKQCPDISQKTVERALKELMDSGRIIKIGGGRYTSYTWNWEKE
jgi:Fic family protein